MVVSAMGNQDGERIFGHGESHNLDIVTTKFYKRPSHLVFFYSGNTKIHIDSVLVRHRDQKLITDAKLVPYETVATQAANLRNEESITNTEARTAIWTESN